MDVGHQWATVRYVERNPVRAGLVQKAEFYKWSSASAHCGLKTEDLLDPSVQSVLAIPDWSTWLTGDDRSEEIGTIRSRTRSGLPLGEIRSQTDWGISTMGTPKRRSTESKAALIAWL
jgi:putative transposase